MTNVIVKTGTVTWIVQTSGIRWWWLTVNSTFIGFRGDVVVEEMKNPGLTRSLAWCLVAENDSKNERLTLRWWETRHSNSRPTEKKKEVVLLLSSEYYICFRWKQPTVWQVKPLYPMRDSCGIMTFRNCARFIMQDCRNGNDGEQHQHQRCSYHPQRFLFRYHRSAILLRRNYLRSEPL